MIVGWRMKNCGVNNFSPHNSSSSTNSSQFLTTIPQFSTNFGWTIVGLWRIVEMMNKNCGVKNEELWGRIMGGGIVGWGIVESRIVGWGIVGWRIVGLLWVIAKNCGCRIVVWRTKNCGVLYPDNSPITILPQFFIHNYSSSNSSPQPHNSSSHNSLPHTNYSLHNSSHCGVDGCGWKIVGFNEWG